jgi:hypothetical protein
MSWGLPESEECLRLRVRMFPTVYNGRDEDILDEYAYRLTAHWCAQAQPQFIGI